MKLEKKYGFYTATSMVVGIVIGAGVFIKGGKVLEETNNNLSLSLIAWLIGGFIMLFSILVFSKLAGRYEKVNGVVDYFEGMFGSKVGYYIGIFMTICYYPALTVVLAYVAADYFTMLIGESGNDGIRWTLTGVFLIFVFALNALAPKLSGKFQVSTTVIKLIPLVLIGVVGFVSGLWSGQFVENLQRPIINNHKSNLSMFFTALSTTAFAYEGWIIATTINGEIKDAKKNLPKALIIGSIVVIGIYLFYNLGISGTIDNIIFSQNNFEGAKLAAITLFGRSAGYLLTTFIIISCLGTCNGLMMGTVRGIFSVSSRNRGPKVEVFSTIDEHTNAMTNSAIFGLLICGFWMIVWSGNINGWWSKIFNIENFFFDISELSILFLYVAYIPLYFSIILKHKDLNFLNRFILPALAILGSIFMAIGCVLSHGILNNVIMLILIFLVLFSFSFFYEKKRKFKRESKHR